MANYGKRQPLNNVEVQDEGLEIESVVNREVEEAAMDANFMEEEMVIHVSPSPNEEDHPCVMLNVNGVSHPIWRGYNVKTKRKYVEVLARCKETKYKQPPRNMSDPESGNQLIPRTSLSYPFQVIEDKNPIGRKWIEAIFAEAA